MSGLRPMLRGGGQKWPTRTCACEAFGFGSARAVSGLFEFCRSLSWSKEFEASLRKADRPPPTAGSPPGLARPRRPVQPVSVRILAGRCGR